MLSDFKIRSLSRSIQLRYQQDVILCNILNSDINQFLSGSFSSRPVSVFLHREYNTIKIVISA